MTDLAESLVQRGVQVTTLSGQGRYTGGTRLPKREVYRGVQIERAWATSFGKGSIVGRLCDYFSFYLGACWKLFTLPRHDIVMTLTTPPMIGLVALIAGRIRRMKVAALVQDIYPDVAVAVGALKSNGIFTGLLDRLNRYVLSHSSRIIVLSACMKKRVLEKLGDNAVERIDIIHNWADGEFIRPLPRGENRFAGAHNLNDQFVVMFSGNLGKVNDFQTVLDAARRLNNRKDILFLFVGEGARKNELEQFVAARSLLNVEFLPYQPREITPQSITAGDAMLVTLGNGLAGLSVPSKIYPIMAAGRPVLYVGDMESDAARITIENGCGAAIPIGNDEELAKLITSWADDRSVPEALGKQSRAAFEARFTRDHAVELYLQSFAMSLADKTPAPGFEDLTIQTDTEQ